MLMTDKLSNLTGLTEPPLMNFVCELKSTHCAHCMSVYNCAHAASSVNNMTATACC